MAQKTYPLRPTLKLWGAIRVVGGLFIILVSLLAAAFVRQAILLGALPADEFVTEDAVYEAMSFPDLLLMSSSLLFFPVYLLGAFLTMKWYLRSLRNGNRLHRGFETSPGWAIWGFVIPVVSLFKPYGMTSELWRSSAQPDRWKGMKDTILLRWWWGLVLIGGFLATGSDIAGRYGETAGQLKISALVMVASLVIQAVAGLLFLRISGAISRRQSALIEAGYEAPPSAGPAWSS